MNREEILKHIGMAAADGIKAEFESIRSKENLVSIKFTYQDAAEDRYPELADPETGLVTKEVTVSVPFSYDLPYFESDDPDDRFVTDIYFDLKKYGIEISDEDWIAIADEIEIALEKTHPEWEEKRQELERGIEL